MSKLWAERLTAFGMIIFAGYFLTQSFGMPSTSGAFPQFTEYTIILLAVVMIVRAFITKDPKFIGQIKTDFSYNGVKPVYVMVVGIVYGWAIFEFGFYVTSVLFFFLVTYMTGFRNYKIMGIVAIVLFPLMYLFFNIGLGADLPQGFLI